MASRDASPALSPSPGVAATQYVAATTGLRAATPSPSSTNNGHTISSVTLALNFYETITKPWFSSTRFQLRTAKDPKSTQGHDPTPSPYTSTTSDAPSPDTSSLLPIPPTTIISDAIVTSIVTGTNGIALGHASSEYTSMTTYTTVIASVISSRSVSLDGTIPITSHQFVSGTNPGSIYPTAMSVVPSSESSRLPMILGPALGVPFLVALGIILYKCYTRRRRVSRRAQSNTHLLQRDTTPPVATPALLGGQIPAPPRASRNTDRLRLSRDRSQADDSSQIIEVQASGSSANGSSRDSLQTTEVTNSHTVGTALTSIYFFSSSGVGSERINSPSTHNTTSSSELNFVPPVPSDATSTYSPPVSPTGHYRVRSLAEREKSLEQGGSNVLYFRLAESDMPVVGTHLRALLDEARMN